MTTILLDIEGTTTPISFVYDVLFPYARTRIRAALAEKAAAGNADEVIDAFRAAFADERAAGFTPPALEDEGTVEDIAQSVADFAHWQMEYDRKSTALKQLQGEIWRAGYEDGTLQGVVYPDVAAAMERWRAAGHRIAIYSSGSVQAQRLIFGYSDQGDLRPYIDAYFDTKTGPKKAAESYRTIAKELGVAASDILFVTDNYDELCAARTAGLQTRLAVRPGNAPVEATDVQRIASFEVDALGV